jgi:hypothetical protein
VECVLYETTNLPVVAFHNSLDDTNAGITPGYHKSSSVTISSRSQRAHTKAKVTFGLVLPCRKTHLATYI